MSVHELFEQAKVLLGSAIMSA